MSTPRKRLSVEIQTKRSLTCYINDFMECHPETRLCENNIKTLTDKYREWNSCYSKYGGAIRFSRKVLYYIAERMYWSRFRDSTYVELVLLYIFEMNKDLAVIISPIEEGMFSSSVFESTSDFTQYFLLHAYRQKVLFDGYRLPSAFFYTRRWSEYQVLKYVIRQLDCELLRQMLRFGAMFLYKNYSEIQKSEIHPKSASNPNYLLSFTLFEILKLNPDLSPLEDLRKTFMEVFPFRTYPLPFRVYCIFVTCLELVLKDVSQVSLDELHKALCLKLHGVGLVEECRRNEDIIDFTRKFSANVIDDFQNHFIMPLSLKQISRLVIRRELNKNWELPEGIYKLPIPERLKMYIDV